MHGFTSVAPGRHPTRGDEIAPDYALAEVLLQQWSAVTQGDPRLVVVLGRRQVGKTFLIQHALDRIRAQPARAVFASGLPSASEEQQLGHLADAVQRDLGPDTAYLPTRFDSWDEALRWAAAAARERPLALVLDEMPWFTDSTPVMPGLLQQMWDGFRLDTSPPSLLLVLCGSAVAAMKGLVDGAGPLFGRTAAELTVDPFDLRAAALVLPSLRADRLVEAYAACGGYPLHLQAWDPDAATDDNVRRLAGQPGGLLLRDGERLTVDLPAAGGYRRTLHAVGSGEQRRVDVARSAAQRIEQPLDLLLRSSLIRVRRPLGAPDRVPGRYELTDAYLRFWYEICWADQALIEGGAGDGVLSRRHGRWQRHLGWVFEELARTHANQLAAAGLLPRGQYGEWWTDRGGQVQIDVLGLDRHRTVSAGEVRWDARPLRERDLDELTRKVARAPDPVQDPTYAFWSRGGADAAVHAAGAHVYSPGDLLTVP